MILELDCGNTRIKWRSRDGERVSHQGAFPTSDSLNGVISSELGNESILRVLIGSVLDDDFRKKLVAWSLGCFGINPEFAVSEPRCNGVINGYQLPEKLGVDRWLAILAAKAHTPGASIIVDCGSAITVDLVTAQGEHLGGYIAPGLRLMREALGANTSAIKLGQIGYPDNDFPGRNTVAAIKSAELAMISGLVTRAKAALLHYEASEPAIWVTGGDGQWLSSQLENSRFEADLVLDGLAIALPQPTGAATY
jgi:type III pantothenate kinase